MNCLDVRRLLLAEPKSQDPDLHQHVQQCTDCTRFAKDLIAFESDLNQASKVAIPEGLASRILLRQRMSSVQNRRKRIGMAMAAVLLLGFTIILAGLFNNGVLSPGQKNLDQIVLLHVNSELHHLNDRQDLSLKQVNTVLKEHGSKLNALPGRMINYAGACQIRKNNGVHMVVNTRSGPITVLFMPGEFVRERSQFQDKRFQGVILPTKQGSMAIVGEDLQQIEQLERELLTQVVDLS